MKQRRSSCVYVLSNHRPTHNSRLRFFISCAMTAHIGWPLAYGKIETAVWFGLACLFEHPNVICSSDDTDGWICSGDSLSPVHFHKFITITNSYEAFRFISFVYLKCVCSEVVGGWKDLLIYLLFYCCVCVCSVFFFIVLMEWPSMWSAKHINLSSVGGRHECKLQKEIKPHLTNLLCSLSSISCMHTTHSSLMVHQTDIGPSPTSTTSIHERADAYYWWYFSCGLWQWLCR